jgi:positive regulator of sigma E activity
VFPFKKGDKVTIEIEEGKLVISNTLNLVNMGEG